jgi:hypothetical protein
MLRMTLTGDNDYDTTNAVADKNSVPAEAGHSKHKKHHEWIGEKQN